MRQKQLTLNVQKGTTAIATYHPDGIAITYPAYIGIVAHAGKDDCDDKIRHVAEQTLMKYIMKVSE